MTPAARAIFEMAFALCSTKESLRQQGEILRQGIAELPEAEVAEIEGALAEIRELYCERLEKLNA